MLQQTQVERVIPYYENFLREFPTLRSLAHSSLARVLRVWQGLGYNRRAKYLHEAAQQIMVEHHGIVPATYEDLRALPGVGDYTARAVRTFAWNEPEIFIETNIRTAFIHHFFPHQEQVLDSQLHSYMSAVLDREKPLEWYWALMDYGSFLKRTVGNVSKRSRHHVPQKPFKGSDREIRGAILRAVSRRPHSLEELCALPFPTVRIKKQTQALLTEKLITFRVPWYTLPN